MFICEDGGTKYVASNISCQVKDFTMKLQLSDMSSCAVFYPTMDTWFYSYNSVRHSNKVVACGISCSILLTHSITHHTDSPYLLWLSYLDAIREML